MRVPILILGVIQYWQLWAAAGLLLALFSLVSYITAFEKRPMAYYKPPLKLPEESPAQKEKDRKNEKEEKA